MGRSGLHLELNTLDVYQYTKYKQICKSIFHSSSLVSLCHSNVLLFGLSEHDLILFNCSDDYFTYAMNDHVVLSHKMILFLFLQRRTVSASFLGCCGS